MKTKPLLLFILSFILLLFTFIVRIYGLLFSTIIIVISIGALVFSSDAFVDEVVPLSSRLRISSGSMGKFILGTVAVLDEIAVVLNSSFRHLGGISLGTIMGSNISTLLILLPFIPLIYIGGARKSKSGPLLILASSLIAVPLALFHFISDITFVPLFLLIFIGYLLMKDNRPVTSEVAEGNYSVPIMLLSIILLFLSSNSLVEYTDSLTAISGISQFYLGFIVTGIAGSLPELVMFVTSLRKVDRDAAIGVLVGSTIYKGALLLGVAMIITKLDFYSAKDTIFFMVILAAILSILSAVRMKKYYAPVVLIAVIISGLYLL